MTIEILLVGKGALRAIRNGDLEPLIPRAAGHSASESDFAPGLWEVPMQLATVMRIRKVAMLNGQTVSHTLERIGLKEIHLDEVSSN